MPLYELLGPPPALHDPVIVAAFDGWVDAGAAATTAAAILGASGTPIARFDGDALFDYRSRRPTLEIRNGRLASIEWPEITLRHARFGDRDLLVLAGAEPDDRWRRLASELRVLVDELGIREWISLGAIPAAVAHTRPVPVLGTASRDGILRGGVDAGPTGLLRVPAAALSVLEMTMAESGIDSIGYFAQVPHYVSGPYAPASLELLKTLERHFDVELPRGDLAEESRQLRTRLDAAAAADETTRAYVERLEAMIDEERQPAGDDLIADIERFLRERNSDDG